jgi:hypothetical protein
VTPLTVRGPSDADDEQVRRLKVALVSRTDSERLAVARAFDRAPASWEVSIHTECPAQADVVVMGPDVADQLGDVDGAVLFDAREPHRALDLVQEIWAARLSRRYLITGAGRGVGVTALAVHLAAALARNEETCLLDLDPDWGLEPWIGLDSSDEKTPDRLPLAAHPVRGGFRIVLARRCEQGVREIKNECSGSFARLVMDRPSPLASADLPNIAGAVLVMSPAPSSIARARELIAHHGDASWALVLNRQGPGGETTRAQIERSLGQRIAVELPCTPSLRDAEERGRLLSSNWFRYVRRVDALCGALEKT